MRVLVCLWWIWMFSSSAALAQSLEVTGSLRAQLPVLTNSASSVPVANVKETTVILTVNADSGCQVVDTLDSARAINKTGDMGCVFTWKSVPVGLSGELLKASGYAENDGPAQLEYEIAFYNGVSEKKIIIDQDAVGLDIAIPQPPVITDVNTTFSGGNYSGLTVYHYQSRSFMKEIVVSVEPRQYVQQVDIGRYGNCTIGIMEDECTITTRSFRFGNASRDIKGYLTEYIKINSQNQFFPDIQELYSVIWDYSGPEVLDFAMRGYTSEIDAITPQTQLIVDGQVISVPNNTGMVVLRSPHSSDFTHANLLRFSEQMEQNAVWRPSGDTPPTMTVSRLSSLGGTGQSRANTFTQNGIDGIDAGVISQCVPLSGSATEELSFRVNLRSGIGTFGDNVIVRLDAGCDPQTALPGMEQELTLTEQWSTLQFKETLDLSSFSEVGVYIYGSNGVDVGDQFFISAPQLAKGELSGSYIPTLATSRDLGVIDGDWKRPSDVELTLDSDQTEKNRDIGYIVNDVEIVRDGSRISSVYRYQTEFDGTLLEVGEYYIASLDVTDAQDGFYLPSVLARDAYQNGSSARFGAFKLDRSAPVIGFSYNTRKMSNDADIYFLDDITVYAEDGKIGGATITSATIDNQAISLSGPAGNYKLMSGENVTLVPGQDYQITVEAIDIDGNVQVTHLDVSYMPVNFKVEGLEENVYLVVQDIKYEMIQQTGLRCRPANSYQTALSRASYGQYGCYAKWSEIDGFSVADTISRSLFVGQYQALGVANVAMDVYFVTSEGKESLAYEFAAPVHISQPELPVITVNNEPDIDSGGNGIYSMGLRGGLLSRFRVTASNAPFMVEINIPGEGVTQTLISPLRNRSTRTTGRAIYLRGGTLWQTKNIGISAYYVNNAELKAEQTLDMVYVPSRFVKAAIGRNFRKALNVDTRTEEMKIGVYNRSQADYVYDPATMGEWTGYLALKEPGGEITPLTTEIPITDGREDFDIDITDFGLGSTSYIGIAHLKSEVYGYSRILESNRNFIRVFKGTEIDGGVRASYVYGKVPFRFLAQYKTDSIDDLRALGDVIWQLSDDDGATWVDQPVQQSTRTFRTRFEQAGTWRVRAKVKNAFTGVEAFTDDVLITAYNVPLLNINGPRTLLIGSSEEYTLEDYGSIANPTLGDIEWSLDNGKNWSPGLERLTVSAPEEGAIRLRARMRYNDTEQAGRFAWDTDFLTINVRPPSAPRVIIKPPAHAEVGKTLSINAKAIDLYPGLDMTMKHRWILPEGAVVEGDTLNWEILANYMSYPNSRVVLRYEGFLEGMEDETKREQSFIVRIWKYRFPNIDFFIDQHTTFAPSRARVRPVVERLDIPERVTYNYEYSSMGDIVVQGQQRDIGILTAAIPGAHQFKVKVTDSRGNVREFIEVMNVILADPPVITLRKNLSNPALREPLDIVAQVGVRLSHREDRVEDYRFYLNGQLVKDDYYRYTYDSLMEGSHEVKVEIETEHGHIEELVEEIVVIDNKIPNCSPRITTRSIRIDVASNCIDSDGRMRTYNWYIDGVLSGARSSTLRYYYRTPRPSSINVKLEAFDDSGEPYVETMTIAVPPN